MSKLTTIDFHGAKLIAVPGDKPETTLVAMKPIVEGMGLDWTYQFRKISGHPVLSTCVAVIAIQMPGDDQVREHTFLSLEMMNFWLATIHPDRIKDETVRARVIEYQTECARVLFNHFFGKAIASGSHLTAREVGGIAKGVMNKALAPIEARVTDLATRLEQALTSYDPTAGFTTDYQPIISVLADKKVPPKGRRSLSANCSRRCTRFLLARGLGGSIRISRETGRRLFHVDAVREWLKVEGDSIIRGHMDRVIGQSAMNLSSRRKKPVARIMPTQGASKRPFPQTPEPVS